MFKKVFDFSFFRNTKSITVMALMVAISIVCGKFLAIPVGDYLRFSFESLPIMLVGFLYGPFAGMFTGIAADLLGCVLRGYAINPIITFGSAAIGIISGLLFIILGKNLKFKIIFSNVISHILGSVIIKTIGLCVYYGYPYKLMFLLRSANYLAVAVAEILILLILFSNRGFVKTFSLKTGD